MAKYDFGQDFFWGTSAASFQIEGAWNEDGKGESIWDRFCHIPGKVDNGDTGDVACDHYHRYPEDIAIMKQLGIQVQRLSISWPRIYPDGKGRINPKGIEFYQKVVDTMLENGIEPFVVLYHWDLPQKLSDLGGWLNPEIVNWFADFSRTVFRALKGKVKYWGTVLEPHVICYGGYNSYDTAPGIKDFSSALLAGHNLLKAHGRAVQIFREENPGGEIGLITCLPMTYPVTDSPEDLAAAERNDKHYRAWFLDPIFKGSYPADLWKWYEDHGVVLPEVTEEDLKLISEPIDFLGTNYYSADFVKAGSGSWPLMLDQVKPDVEVFTDMGWNVYPKGFYDTLMRTKRDYDPKMVITENGAAFYDVVNRDGRIADDSRIEYLYRHLKEVYRAKQDGARIMGYMVWSIMDNFEWSHGYSKRFGLVHIDYKTLKRTIKDSGYWYSNVIKNNGFED